MQIGQNARAIKTKCNQLKKGSSMPHLDFIQQCIIQISHSVYSFDGLVNACLLGQQL